MSGRSGLQQRAFEFGQDNRKLLGMKRVEVRMLIESAASDSISVETTWCGVALNLHKIRRTKARRKYKVVM